MTTSADVRSELVHALRDDLIGPDADDPRDQEHLEESLPSPPTHWYLAGFLAPTGQAIEEREDPEADEQITAAVEEEGDGEAEVTTARRPVFPSSIGLSVLVRADTTRLVARVTFGTYAPGAPKRGASQPPPAPEGEGDEPGALRQTWTRTHHDHELTLELDGRSRFEAVLPDTGGVVLRGVVRSLPASELTQDSTAGARYVTLFLINERRPHDRPEVDRGYVFQIKLALSCAEGFLPRPNQRGARATDDLDEKIGNLHYRDAYEYAVGHGVAATARVEGHGEDIFCEHVATCWVPTAEVEKVVPCQVRGVTLGMEELAAVADGEALWKVVSPLVQGYRAWIAQQSETDPGTPVRRETQAALLQAAEVAARRIEDGVWALRDDAQALEAFRIANRVMAAAAWQRSGAQLRREQKVPTWRPFQLAFLLMNIVGQIDPQSSERDAVDLIFFPTGGGKTEAYLGLAAFSLALRRLKNDGIASAGVAVLMRYTLRLLTLDQLERAALLICALELERRQQPEKLGPQRFSIGLWVGKAATPNRFGNDKDRDETTARNRTMAFRKDPKASPSPIPLDRCPWCGEPFSQDTFELLPDSKNPDRLRALCFGAKCPFRPTKTAPDGIPVVAVDDEIYRELPCFLIATVDKFAALPWVGKTGLLLGKNVTHHDALGFYGPAERPPGARPLARPLLPPDLIIQDELHLISGPLGTMVGLYETAIDHLTTRDGVRPKIVASTATVRRAHAQIRALFGRDRVDVFPPPGPNRRHSFFAETLPAAKVNARLYVGLAAPGRSQKVLLMRSYIALLGAAKKAYERDPAAADPYMTLVGYFNSLRELGGSQRIVEDEVRARLLRASLRRRVGENGSKLSDRRIQDTCEELTSRRNTDQVKEAKARLERPFFAVDKKRDPVDVALASNMISVGVDITRLGLMVVCSQPKATAEYIQATSRVGRDDQRPGLVVTLLNVHKPRDRSHFEHFAAFHESFYRSVEATSVTPFAPRAVDRGLVGVLLALARLGIPQLTPPDGAANIEQARSELGFLGDVLAARVEAHREQQRDDAPMDEVKAALRLRVESFLDSWVQVAQNDPAHVGLAYQKYEGSVARRHLLHMPLDPELAGKDSYERKFVANRSMRDVEHTVDVYVTTLKAGAMAREDA